MPTIRPSAFAVRYVGIIMSQRSDDHQWANHRAKLVKCFMEAENPAVAADALRGVAEQHVARWISNRNPSGSGCKTSLESPAFDRKTIARGQGRVTCRADL